MPIISPSASALIMPIKIEPVLHLYYNGAKGT